MGKIAKALGVIIEESLKLSVCTTEPIIVPHHTQAAQSAARTEFRSGYFKNTPPMYYDRTEAVNKQTVPVLAHLRVFVCVRSLGIY